jgi:hypothetical protein
MAVTKKKSAQTVGRRRHSDIRQRQAQVAVRLDPTEFAILRDVAERDGRSLASALREGFLSSAGTRVG